MNTKICKVCGIEKDYSEFHKMKNRIGGVRTTCKECRKEEKKEYLSRDYVIIKNKERYQKEKVEISKRMKIHYRSFNGQYHSYKTNAKRRGIEFQLTQEECKLFYKTNCYFCGDEISGIGIDRIDSNIGYVQNNVIPCCTRCNYMKHIMKVDEFIQHIKQILNHLSK